MNHRPSAIIFLRDCEGCGRSEERTWTDSWTGRELCNACLGEIVGDLAMSPASDDDNLDQLLEGTE